MIFDSQQAQCRRNQIRHSRHLPDIQHTLDLFAWGTFVGHQATTWISNQCQQVDGYGMAWLRTCFWSKVFKYLYKERFKSEEVRYNSQMLREVQVQRCLRKLCKRFGTKFEIESLSSNFLIACLNESALYCIIQLHW